MARQPASGLRAASAGTSQGGASRRMGIPVCGAPDMLPDLATVSWVKSLLGWLLRESHMEGSLINAACWVHSSFVFFDDSNCLGLQLDLPEHLCRTAPSHSHLELQARLRRSIQSL